MFDWFNSLFTRALAQTNTDFTNQVINNIKREIINPIIILLFAASLLYFLWGVFEFIRSSGTGGEKKDDGKRHMLWGIIGMVIMMSAMGLVNMICTTINCA